MSKVATLQQQQPQQGLKDAVELLHGSVVDLQISTVVDRRPLVLTKQQQPNCYNLAVNWAYHWKLVKRVWCE